MEGSGVVNAEENIMGPNTEFTAPLTHLERLRVNTERNGKQCFCALQQQKGRPGPASTGSAHLQSALAKRRVCVILAVCFSFFCFSFSVFAR